MSDLTIDPTRLAAIVAALDANDTARGIARHDALMLRVGKVAEEYGEAWAALGGMYGQNPHKGRTHTEGDVVGELFDVALTALVAAASLPDAAYYNYSPLVLAPVDLWQGMTGLGQQVGQALVERHDPVWALHRTADLAFRLAGTIVGPHALADHFAAHVEAKTARLLAAAAPEVTA